MKNCPEKLCTFIYEPRLEKTCFSHMQTTMVHISLRTIHISLEILDVETRGSLVSTKLVLKFWM